MAGSAPATQRARPTSGEALVEGKRVAQEAPALTRRSLRLMTLEESPYHDGEERAQQNQHRLDLRADIVV